MSFWPNLIFVTTTVFHFTWESVTKNMKNVAQWEFTLGKFWDNKHIGNTKTHFHPFYPIALLLLWQIVLNNIILIFFLGYFIVLYLCFSYVRIITPHSLSGSRFIFDTLLSVCSSTDCYIIDFVGICLEAIFINCIKVCSKLRCF